MDWVLSWQELMREVVYGVKPGAGGTWFVEKSEAILPILREISAQRASENFGGKVSCIAAHTAHTAYYMELAAAGLRGEHVEADWPGSWAVQAVDEAAWQATLERLESAHAALVACVPPGKEFSDQDDLTYAFANVAHAAFHLGSIRQLGALIR